jgi:hypothetical protein
MKNDVVAVSRRSNSLLAALRFLLPLRREGLPGDADAGAMARAAVWFVPIGLLTGLAWVGAFRLAWRVFGETANMRVLPAMTVTLLECLITGLFLVLGLARTIHLLAGLTPRHLDHEPSSPLSPVGTLVLALTVLCQWVLIVSFPDVTTWWPSDWDWRHYFNFMYPRAIFRPLILAPLWGRWGVLLAATLGRTARQADPLTAALGQAMRPSRLLRQAFLPIVLTAIYCSREHNRFIGVVLAMVVFAATYVVSVVMARRGGGQTRQSLFAAGQIAQLTCLALYRGFWPFIHG